MEDVFLEATDGDDFIGVQTYSRTRVGPDGVLGPEDGVADADHGLRVLARVARGARSAGPGRSPKGEVPLLVTENGIGTDDDDQRIALRPRPRSRACSTASTTASTCAATRTGACSTTSSGPSGYGPRFGIVDVDRTTFERTPEGQRPLARAEWPRPTPSVD